MTSTRNVADPKDHPSDAGMMIPHVADVSNMFGLPESGQTRKKPPDGDMLCSKPAGRRRIAGNLSCGETKGTPPVARPKLNIDEERVAELALNGAKNNEIANILGVDDETIRQRFSTLLTKKRSELRARLRETQIQKALNGDTAMLIWLGKNMLDQTDKLAQENSGKVEIKVTYEDIPIEHGSCVSYMGCIGGKKDENKGNGNGHEIGRLGLWN